MSSTIIPESARVAARRAFVRTLLQGYASALAGLTITSASIAAFIESPNWPQLGIAAGGLLLAPLVGALVAYLDMLYGGIPSEYATPVVDGYSDEAVSELKRRDLHRG